MIRDILRRFCENIEMNPEITLTEIESAINFWRRQSPSVGEEMRLCPEAAALANHYALLIISHQRSLPVEALDPEALTAYQAWKTTVG